MSAHSRFPIKTFAMIFSLGLAGCASDGGLFSTGSLSGEPEPVKVAQTRVDPACVTLTSQIDALRKEGVAEKVEKASQKKHKLTNAELAKVDQLNKANAEFQSKCSTLSPTQSAQVSTPR